MAGKTLKKTKDTDTKETRITARIENEEENMENIYKLDTDNIDKNSKVRKIEDDDSEVDEIFGNVNKWLKDAEDEIAEKKSKRRLAKIEEGIKSSKKTKKTTVSKKTKKTELNESDADVEDKIYAIDELKEEDNDEPVRVTPTKRTRKTSTTKATKTVKTKKTEKTTKKKTTLKKSTEIDIENNNEIEKIENEEIENKPNEIKMHTENNLTEIILKKNSYKIELQKTEYNIYTNTNETSYLIVRDPMLRMITKEGFILLEKQGETYEITTNQDFKINYVIDNLERKDSEVNFKLTNLTEIYAYEDGLVFEIDEEKVIENNLEDNNTLVISEEDGKVYLPYSKDDIKNEVLQNKGTKIADVIEEKYILPLDKYKNSMRARFREGYNLMYRKEGKSKKSAIMLGIELMFETNLHPAIISACKNLEELDIYLDCLEDNELEKFSCFKIIYKSLPTLRKKAKFQEF